MNNDKSVVYYGKVCTVCGLGSGVEEEKLERGVLYDVKDNYEIQLLTENGYSVRLADDIQVEDVLHIAVTPISATYGYYGIIEIPKLKLMSELSIRLGAQANPVVGSFAAVGVPTGTRGNSYVSEFYFLNNDIDSDF